MIFHFWDFFEKRENKYSSKLTIFRVKLTFSRILIIFYFPIFPKNFDGFFVNFLVKFQCFPNIQSRQNSNQFEL